MDTANMPERPRKGRTLVQFAFFLVLGGFAALTNIVTRYLLNFVMPFEPAVILAYIAGMIIAFALYGSLLFDGSESALSRRIIRFTQVNLLGGFLAWVVSTVMARILLPAARWEWHPFEVAHIIGVVTPTFTSYLLHKHYTFV